MTNSKMPSSEDAFGNENNLLLFLSEFDRAFPTEESAVEDLKNRFENEGLLYCHHCGQPKLEKKYGARVLKCLDCGNQTWITSGTFFHYAKRIKPRLAAIWLMERGCVFGSSKFHRLVDIAQSSAFNILKRIAMVINAHMERDIYELPSSIFSTVVCKRSRETPARAHPVAEQEEIDVAEEQKRVQEIVLLEQQEEELEQEEGLEQEKKSEQEKESEQLSSQEQELYDLLSETPVSFETLYARCNMEVSQAVAGLVMLEIAGLVVSLPGNNYARSPRNQNLSLNVDRSKNDEFRAKYEPIIAAAGTFIRKNFHGISRKYLQIYLALRWYYADQGVWNATQLLNACLRFGSVTQVKIADFVTSAMVKHGMYEVC